MTGLTVMYIIISGIIALLIALFQYVFRSKKNRTNYILAFLRFITVFLLLILLVNPKIESVSYYNEKPNLVVAIDDSNSIKFLNQVDTVNDIKQVLKSNKKLQEAFNLDFYSFSDKLKRSDSLTFLNKQTNINEAFKSLSEIYNNTISPTVLITDGNQTFGNDYQFTVKSYKQPIFPIILGDTTKHVDLKISQLNVNKYAFYKNKFPVEVILVYTGEESVKSNFVVTSGAKIVYQKPVSFTKNESSKIINFTLPANQIGVFSYKASIQPLKTEKNTRNNNQNFAIEVIDEKSNIAIVSSLIHPDLGALKKSIESIEQRTAELLKPNDFLTKMADYQLAILYQPDARFKAVLEKMNRENMNRFIISGSKTNWRFLNNLSSDFSHDQIGQTENYQATIHSNYSEFIIPNLDFESFPPLLGKYGDINIQVPFQTLLYKKIGRIETEKPLLLTFENKSRREAILLGENIWRWRAQSYLNTNSFNSFDDFISKLIQYLASKNKRERLSLTYESFYKGSSSTLIKAQYFNKNYEFDNRETLTITVVNEITKDTKSFPMVLKNNNFEVDLSSLSPSDYKFSVKANASNISKSGSFKILDYNIEEQFTHADATRLKKIANKSQGNTYFANNISELVNSLIRDNRFAIVEKSTKKSVSLIDWKYLLGLLILALSAEWFYRKYKGLI